VIRMPAPGDHFGRYRVVRELGRGGMGVVHVAHDPVLDREVALKIMAPQLAADEDYRHRFRREAQTLSRIDSPHVVAVHDHGEHEGCLFLVTALVPDGDLLAMVTEHGAPPPSTAVDLGLQVLDGLEDAHRAGVVHRDVKPSNVLLHRRGERVQAVLCDFGIATLPGGEVTRTGSLVGSFPYMAPERHRGEQTGVLGDVYAAGCLLWHLLTGAPPYAGTDVEVAVAHLQAPVPQLPGSDHASRSLNQVLRRAMAKDPADRYPSARAMRTDLAAVLDRLPAALALPEVTSVRHSVLSGEAISSGSAGVRRRRRAAAVAGSAVGAVLVAAVGLYAGLAAGGGGDPLVTTANAPGSPLTATATTTVTAQPVPVLPGATLSTEDAPRARGGGASATGGGDEGLTLLPEQVGDPTPVEPADPGGSGGDAGAGGDGGGSNNNGGGTNGGNGNGGGGGTTPAPSPSASPQPKNDFRCWNGEEVAGGASSCPPGPTGATGLRYVFVLDGACSRRGPITGQVSVLQCERSTPYGKGVITLIEWDDVPTMKEYIDSFNSGKPFNWTHGKAYARPTPNKDLKYLRTNLYGNHRFSINLHGKTNDARKWLLGQVRYRTPETFRGYAL